MESEAVTFKLCEYLKTEVLKSEIWKYSGLKSVWHKRYKGSEKVNDRTGQENILKVTN